MCLIIYTLIKQLSVRISFNLLSSPFQSTSFRSKQEEKKRTRIWFASSVPKYKPTEKAYFCRLNAVFLDRLSVKQNQQKQLQTTVVVAESLPRLHCKNI